MVDLTEKDMGVMLYVCRPPKEVQKRIDIGAVKFYEQIGEPLDEQIETLRMIYNCALLAKAKMN